MLPEAGATELIFLAAVALIVVGPKDLPVLMRKVGQWVAKMRGLAAEFRSSFDELARQSELDELRKEVEALRNTRMPDPLADLPSTFDEMSAGLDPSGFANLHDPHAGEAPAMTALPPQTARVEAAPAVAKPARAPRKPKASTPTRASKPAPKTKVATDKSAKIESAEAKPRARRPAASAEAKG
ncbi:MAG TPA: Sec-independent protein translocase protein TatB [Caulobacteraceae bacterium]|jgi:sec-independent protein translocase protein TatB|nr:Sec-independent protein translocase protein TatB [Caulobacteraceae bacterium]